VETVAESVSVECWPGDADILEVCGHCDEHRLRLRKKNAVDVRGTYRLGMVVISDKRRKCM
jgi:hypothetical protein